MKNNELLFPNEQKSKKNTLAVVAFVFSLISIVLFLLAVIVFLIGTKVLEGWDVLAVVLILMMFCYGVVAIFLFPALVMSLIAVILTKFKNSFGLASFILVIIQLTAIITATVIWASLGEPSSFYNVLV